jgi:GDP-L-fucose synthase
MKKILITGGSGLAGSALVSHFNIDSNYKVYCPQRSELDVLDQKSVDLYIKNSRPDIIIIASAIVGGIECNNNNPISFIYKNMQMQNNIISSAWSNGVQELILLGSNCIYPKHSELPIKENSLLTGDLETTNRPYAIAKISGIEFLSAINRELGYKYFAVMPPNLYGKNDNFAPAESHVLQSLMVKVCDAKNNNKKSIEVWGSGDTKREFLNTEDFARATKILLEADSSIKQKYIFSNKFPIINVGSSVEYSIHEILEKICRVVDYHPEIIYTRPELKGTHSKLLDSSGIANFNWEPQIRDLELGIKKLYLHYVNNEIRKK